MGITLVFSELQVLLSHICEKEKENKKEKGKKEKRIEKERKEGGRNKKRWEE